MRHQAHQLNHCAVSEDWVVDHAEYARKTAGILARKHGSKAKMMLSPTSKVALPAQLLVHEYDGLWFKVNVKLRGSRKLY